MEKFLVGSQLMIIGMGTVFFFLTIMICAMNISENIIKFINKYYPEINTEEKNKKNTNKSKNTTGEEVAIAIVSAIHAKEMMKC